MALPQIDIPAHVADQHGYNLTRGIASDLRDARDRLNADPSIRNADLQTQRLKAIIDPLATAIREGALDAAPTRKASAVLCLSELSAIAAVVAPLSPRYGKIVAAAKLARNEAGEDVTYTQVQAETQLSDADLAAITAAINTAIGE